MKLERVKKSVRWKCPKGATELNVCLPKKEKGDSTFFTGGWGISQVAYCNAVAKKKRRFQIFWGGGIHPEVAYCSLEERGFSSLGRFVLWSTVHSCGRRSNNRRDSPIRRHLLSLKARNEIATVFFEK